MHDGERFICRNFVDGQWVAPASVRTLVDPSTELEIGVAHEADAEVTARAVAAARHAFDAGPWPRMNGAERRAILREIADDLMALADELAEAESANAGATIRTSNVIHVGYALAHLDRLVDMAERAFDEPLPPLQNPNLGMQLAVREPIGVCGAIIPWNVPLLMAIWKVIPALAMGNTVVLKPAPATPVTAVMLAEVIERSRLPHGVFNLVLGDREPGEALAGSPDVDKIAFTGSTAVGKRVGELAAQNVTKVTLELGGKSANILLSDADLDVAIDGSVFAFTMHQGQICLSGTRLLVPRSLHDEVVSRLVDRVSRIRVGPTDDWDSDLGPLINQQQLDRVGGYVELGQEQGAKVAIGGRRPDHLDMGYFYEPTVLVDVDNSMRVAREEIFGPVLCVIPYDSEDDAIAIANDSPYGLAGGVWTRDLARGVRVARQIRAGTMWVNEWHSLTVDAPFGGYKQSGVGRELGPHGLDEYTEVKTIHVGLAEAESRMYGMMMTGGDE